jgi:hypothetical protein
VIDRNRNLRNINNARIKGDLIVDGTIDAAFIDRTGWTLYDKAVSATVSIYNSAEGSVCSGWFVSPDGWVATAAHTEENTPLF